MAAGSNCGADSIACLHPPITTALRPRSNGLYLSPATPLFLLFVVLGVYLVGQFAFAASQRRRKIGSA
jgi:hypothetical protein